MSESLPQTTPDSEDPSPPPARGTQIGRFVVLDPIGFGGAGVVLRAYDPDLDRKVALKILRNDGWGADAEARRTALVREAQVMARLQHPNVVTVHEVGLTGDACHVVMELVEGQTLRRWGRERARDWREILAMAVQAGAGLAAAHRAGIVHRDVKPENVLVGDDGRARVSDFGIAALAQTTFGTRGYMAPEQLAGGSLDERTDQYGFCVTLWEALEGERPAADPAIPGARKAPAWVYRALRRGLATRPEDRWPTMEALLQALQPQRSERLAVALVAVAALVAVGAAVLRPASAPAERCTGSAGLVASVWDEPARTRVEEAFRRTGRPSASAVFTRVDAAVRGRVDGWAAAHRDACEASHVRHEQSDTMLDLRMQCLARARRELEAMAGALGHIDAAGLDRALTAALASGDVERCADLRALAAATPPPRDPEVARAVDALARELTLLDVQALLGEWKKMRDPLANVIARARRLGHAPVLAHALLLAGTGETMVGDADAGIAMFYDAARVAAVAGDDALVARTLSELMYSFGTRKLRFEAATVTYHLAAAAVARAGASPPLVRQLLEYRAMVLVREGQLHAAFLLRLLVLTMATVEMGESSHETGMALGYLASSLGRTGHARAAVPLFERALATLGRALGEDHPSYLSALSNASSNLRTLYELDAASPMIEKLLAADEARHGPDHRIVGQTVRHLAGLRLHQGRLDEVRTLAERSARIASASSGPKHPDVALAYVLHGWAEQYAGQSARALHWADQALAIQIEALGADHDRVSGTHVLRTRALLGLGRVAEAHAAATRAMAIDAKTTGVDHPDHAASLVAMGDVLGAQRRFADAEPLYRKALVIVSKDAVARNPALGDPLVGLCEVLLARGDRAGAAAFAERALALPLADEPLKRRARVCRERAN